MKKNLNKYILFIVFPLLLIVMWRALNVTHPWTRDEAYYLSYSESWNDGETKDLRYVTEKDIYQGAIFPFYRLALRATNYIPLGNGFFDKRILNLFLLLLLYLSFVKFFKAFQINNYFSVVPVLYVMVFPKISKYLFMIRPDWTVISLTIMSVIFTLMFLKSREIRSLYVAGLCASFSAIIYWNGLITLLSFGTVLLTLNECSMKSKLKVLGLSSFVFILFNIIPMSFYYDEFRALSSNSYGTASKVVNSKFYLTYMYSLLSVVQKGYLSKLNDLFSLFILVNIVSLVLFRNNKDIWKMVLVSCIFWLSAFLAIILRSPSPRHSYFFILMLLPSSVLIFNSVLRKLKTKTIVTIACVLTLSFPLIVISKRATYPNREESYAQFQADLRKILEKIEVKRLLTYYEYGTGIPEYSKLFQMSFLSRNFNSKDAFSSFLKSKNVNVIVVSERTRDRMEGIAKGKIPEYYKFLGLILGEEFHYVNSVYSSDYRTNKGKKPRNKEKFESQVWTRSF